MFLYKVTLHGFYGCDYRTWYVVASDSSSAYESVRSWLEAKSIGFKNERALDSIEAIAEEGDYVDQPSRLLIIQASSPEKKSLAKLVESNELASTVRNTLMLGIKYAVGYFDGDTPAFGAGPFDTYEEASAQPTEDGCRLFRIYPDGRKPEELARWDDEHSRWILLAKTEED